MENENEDIVLKEEYDKSTTLENILKKAIESPNMPQIFFYSIEQIDRLIELFFYLTKELNKSIHLVLSRTKAFIEYILEEV